MLVCWVIIFWLGLTYEPALRNAKSLFSKMVSVAAYVTLIFKTGYTNLNNFNGY